MSEIDPDSRSGYEEDYDIQFLDAEIDAQGEALGFSRGDRVLSQVAPSYMVFDPRRQLVFWSIRPQDDCVDLARLFHTGLALEDLVEKAVRLGIIDAEGVELRKFVGDRLSRFAAGDTTFQVRLAGDRWFRVTDKRNLDGTTITSLINVTAVERRERAMALLLGEHLSGLPLFERAARALAMGLGFQTASIARLVGDDQGETIACLRAGNPVEPRRFVIRGTPCEPVYRAGYFAFSGDFLRRFPLLNFDGYFLDVGHGSYVGQVVYNRAGRPVGHVLAFDDGERTFDEGERRLVRMVAEHVAFELEHIDAAQAVTTGEQRLSDFAETASEVFFETDRNLTCIYASAQAQSVTGLDAASWIGHPMSELGSASDLNWKTCLEDMAEQRAFRSVVFAFGMPGRSGPRLSLSGKPLFSEASEFTGYRLAAFAVAPAAATSFDSMKLETEQTLGSVLGSSLEGFALFNADYRLIMCNDKFLNLLFDGNKDKVKPGMSLTQLGYLWLRTGSDAERRKLMKFHLEPDALGGDYLDFSALEQRTLRAIRRRTQEGGLATVYLDITDLKSREAELAQERDAAEQANSTKSMFLANVSHELRTPLNAIIGFAEIMREQLLGPINNPRYYEYVQDIRSSGEHLLDMINDILDLSKAEAGELELTREAIDVGEVMSSVSRLMSEQAESGKLHFVSLSTVGLPRISGDKRRVKQVLINLLSNAIKFTPAGGTIELSAHSDDRSVRITVNDTGIGIAPEELARVMVPFGQVDSEISRRHKGTGLGLPLAKRLVELQGGELTVASEPGRGTRVSVTFPFHADGKEQAA